LAIEKEFVATVRKISGNGKDIVRPIRATQCSAAYCLFAV